MLFRSVTLPPASLSPIQRVCHRDRLAVDADQCAGAAVLYLFSDAMLGGTSFYRARHDTQRTDALMRHWSTLDGEEFSRETGWPSAYMTTSNEHFERIAIVEPRWNRLVFYDGSVFHSSHIEHPERLSSRPAQGRLTLNLFFVCRRSAR